MVNEQQQDGNPFDYSGINKQSKYWAFTINNPTPEEEEALKGLFSAGKCTYIVYGREHWGEGEGTPHIQGYVEFAKLLRRRGVNSLPGLRRACIGSRYKNSTSTQAAEYCKKEGSFEEMGVISEPVQGKRTDLERATDLLRDGGSIREVALEFPSTFVRYHGGLERFRAVTADLTFNKPAWDARWERPQEIKSLILHGESGCGKTVAAKNWLPNALWCRHLDDLALYDQDKYDGIIFDDMSFAHLPREVQIHILDWDDDSSIRIRYRIASIPKHTPKIFTTNTPYQIFTNDAAIARRATYFHARINQ